MSTLDNAIQIAAAAHAGQIRKDGTPYILHPLRVMLRQTDPTAMIVAVLHDVLEDSTVTLDDLRNHGFDQPVLDALVLLTHNDGSAYDAYVDRAAANPLARAVKIADLEDNMDLSRLATVTERDLARTAKYEVTWRRLTGKG